MNDIKEKIAISIGEASTLWKTEMGNEIFNSSRAVELVDEIFSMHQEEIDKLKQENEKLKKCVVWYYENEIVSLDKYIETSNCGQFKYATNLKASEALKEIEE